MKTDPTIKLPTKKHLRRKIVVDDIGTTYIIGELSKEDLQILICALADDLEEARERIQDLSDQL